MKMVVGRSTECHIQMKHPKQGTMSVTQTCLCNMRILMAVEMIILICLNVSYIFLIFAENMYEMVLTSTHNICVRSGFPNGTNGIPISFKVLPMVPLGEPRTEPMI